MSDTLCSARNVIRYIIYMHDIFKNNSKSNICGHLDSLGDDRELIIMERTDLSAKYTYVLIVYHNIHRDDELTCVAW